MKNLLKLSANLLQQANPELKEVLEGLSPIYAKIIFARRVRLQLSQKELAEKANVGLKIITRAEGGYDNLSTETYDKIFVALDLSIQDIATAMLNLKATDDEMALTV